MNSVDKQYQDLLKNILENGNIKKDRTGTGTKSIFGTYMKFDLRKGFPLLTTKKMFTKGIIHELLFFLRGKCSIDYLRENNVHIWDDDCKRWDKESESFVGKIYPHSWRRWGATKMLMDIDKTPFEIKIQELIESDVPTLNSNYGKYRILEDVGNGCVKIQFILTGYSYNVRKDRAKKGIVRDPYYPSIHNICSIGNVDIRNGINKKMYILWKGIVDRCYNCNNDNYEYYGKRGVRLSKKWKCFEFFLKDAQKLQNWEQKLLKWNKYQLDKDIMGNGFLYSNSTCLWAYINDNAKKSKEKYEYTVTNGKINETFVNHVDFIKKESIKNQGNFASMLRGERNNCEGWSLISKKTIINDGIDQIQNIINTLKTNPDDRRMLCIAYNPDVLNEVALPPCHVLFQFYTRELSNTERWELYYNKFKDEEIDNDNFSYPHLDVYGQTNQHTYNGEYDYLLEEENIPTRELSCSWYQRSVDSFLGLPFNIASYALLTHMIAHVCNMSVGDLIFNGGDTHLYLNHLEQAKELISRNVLDSPTLYINPKIKTIDEFNFEDIKIENYVSQGALKAPLSTGL